MWCVCVALHGSFVPVEVRTVFKGRVYLPTNWPLGVNLHWLDLSRGRTECDWFSTNNGEFFPSDRSFGETGNKLHADSCNSPGEFQSLYLTHGGLFGSSMENAVFAL